MKATCSNPNCGKEINRPPFHLSRVKNPYCNKVCHDNHQRIGSLVKKCVICGDNFRVSPSMTKRYSTCSKSACRVAKKQLDRNPNWRGGTTNIRQRAMSTNKYQEWRKAVFERDNYTCVECEQRGGDLEADHIKPWAYFPELRYEIGNGRTLCVSCHRATFKNIWEWRKQGVMYAR